MLGHHGMVGRLQNESGGCLFEKLARLSNSKRSPSEFSCRMCSLSVIVFFRCFDIASLLLPPTPTLSADDLPPDQSCVESHAAVA